MRTCEPRPVIQITLERGSLFFPATARLLLRAERCTATILVLSAESTRGQIFKKMVFASDWVCSLDANRYCNNML